MCEFWMNKMWGHPAVFPRIKTILPKPSTKDLGAHGEWVEQMLQVNGINATHLGNGSILATPKGFVKGYPDREVIVIIKILEVIGNDLRCSMVARWSYEQDTVTHEVIHQFAQLV